MMIKDERRSAERQRSGKRRMKRRQRKQTASRLYRGVYMERSGRRIRKKGICERFSRPRVLVLPKPGTRAGSELTTDLVHLILCSILYIFLLMLSRRKESGRVENIGNPSIVQIQHAGKDIVQRVHSVLIYRVW